MRVYNLLFVFPVSSAHGTVVLGLLGGQPLLNAVDVEAVAALSPHQGTVVSSKLAVRTTSEHHDVTSTSSVCALYLPVESHSTNAAGVVISQPLPDGTAGP